jgi:hypothetical protein
MSQLHPSSALLVACLFASVGSAADLNAPLVDRPTLGSEIKRGWDAATDCNLHNLEALADGQCISEASSTAQQQHSSYKPFELGLYFGEWQAEDLAAMSAQSLSNNVIAQQDAPEHTWEAQGAYVVFRRLQAELGITDAQLMAATTTDMNDFGKTRLEARLRLWKNGDPSHLPSQ